jgi:hypothetical protein
MKYYVGYLLAAIRIGEVLKATWDKRDERVGLHQQDLALRRGVNQTKQFSSK